MDLLKYQAKSNKIYIELNVFYFCIIFENNTLNDFLATLKNWKKKSELRNTLWIR